MNIQILDFFAISRDDKKGLLTGSLKVNLPDLGIHILGVYFSKRKDTWYFKLPTRRGVHHETGEDVIYPVVAFEEREKHRDFINALQVKGREFVENRLSDIENPLIFLKMKQKNQKVAEKR